MLAVLPFIATSLDGDSEFFAAGMHDDLLTQLAQLQSIRVISRTSVMEYKDKTHNIREIGEALGADAILEGRVQSAGGQIRINAQLIDAKTDAHLWAHTYDRAVSANSIFDLQTDIARAITQALHATLTADESDQLAYMPTQNMAAYRAYRKALEVRDTPGTYDVEAFTSALEEAVALDPDFTRAQAELVGSYSFRSFNRNRPEFISKAEQALEQIRKISPKSADFLIAQAFYTYYVLKDFEQALLLINQAQEMAPSDVRLIELKSWIQRRSRDMEGKLASERLMRSLDPRNRKWIDLIVTDLIAMHRYDEARHEIRESPLRSYMLSKWDVILDQEANPDTKRWVEVLQRLQKEYDLENTADLWDALIADRDYNSARSLLQAEGQNWHDNTEYVISIVQRHVLLTASLMQDYETVHSLISDIENQEGELTSLDKALLAAVTGQPEQARLQAARWRRDIERDFAGLVLLGHEACRILGIAGLAAEAVTCLREGMEEPRLVLPFIEPGLPFYDAIRNTPEFINLGSGPGARTN
jgi:TolB-like protein